MIIENFKLDSVKLLNEDIVIKYHTATDNAVQTYELKTRPPHPDFIKSVDVFTTYYERVFGFEKEDDPFVTTVKGITIKDTKIQLTGMLGAVTGQMSSLNTPFFEMESEDLGFNKSDIDRLLENVRIEAWKFIYEKKTSQTSLENDLFPPEELEGEKLNGILEVVKEANTFDTTTLSKDELKQFIKLAILNRPTSKKYFGSYTKLEREELQSLVDGYNEEDYRVTAPTE